VSDKTLEDYAIKSMHQSKMTGVGLAVHAVPDAFILMQTGVGCKYKVGVQISWQDHIRHPNRHEAWTQICEMSLIRGSSARVGPFARSRWESKKPGIMVLVSAYFVELTGEDLPSVAQEVAETLPCPFFLVKTATNKFGGLFEGYAETMRGMLAQQDFTQPHTNAREACIIGSFFTRYEQDSLADVTQLQRLCKVSSLAAGPIFFSGRPWSELSEAWRSEVVIQMPYARPAAKRLKRLLKNRTVVETGLPMGIAGTTAWVRKVTAATGANVQLSEAWIARESAKARAALEVVRESCSMMPIAIFADTPLAIGLVSLSLEMGLKPCLVGLRDWSLGGREAFEQGLAELGFEMPADMEIIERPSLYWISTECMARITRGELHVVIGSTIELRVLKECYAESAPRFRAVPIETGFPSAHSHVVTPRPTLGFAGAVAWAQRVLDATSTAGQL
jgi:nitrogenase molybdenum-iron protein alpha/beta subunit